MWWTTAFCLSLFYDEVVIICTDAGSGYKKTKYSNSYYWCLFRWLYQIERRYGSDQSPDGFFRVYTAMTLEMWEAEIQKRPIKRLRLVICDDTAADDLGKALLNYRIGKTQW